MIILLETWELERIYSEKHPFHQICLKMLTVSMNSNQSVWIVDKETPDESKEYRFTTRALKHYDILCLKKGKIYSDF